MSTRDLLPLTIPTVGDSVHRDAHASGGSGAWRSIAWMVLVGLGYFFLARLVLLLIPFDKQAALLWPSSGVALAAVLILGPRMLPAVFVACAALGWSMGEPPTEVLGAAAVNSSYCAASWWLLARVRSFDAGFGRVQDAVAFLVAGVGATILIKFAGVLAIAAIGQDPLLSNALEAAWVAALAAGVGVLVVTPPILVHVRSGPDAAEASSGWRFETTLFLLVPAAVALVVFDDRFIPVAAMQQMPYALFPVMFWGALRLGPRSVSVAFAVVALVAIWCTAEGVGPYAHAVQRMEGLASLYLFLIILGASALTLSATLAQRRSADRRVRLSESRYRMLIDRMNEGLVILDAEGAMTYVSDRFCELTGYSRSELLGRAFKDIAAAEHAAEQAARQRNLEQGVSESFELRVRKGTGDVIATHVSPRPLFDDQGSFAGSFALVTDVSAQRRAEEQARQHLQQLAHVSRVSSMGEMASAIAHEINQPLTAITNYAYAVVRLLRSGQATAGEALEAMQQVAEEAERAGEVVRRMRSFVRGEEGQVSAVPPAALIEEVLPMVRVEARQAGVALQVDVGDALPSVLVDRIQIQQVLLNLVRNAIEAIDGAQAPTRLIRIAATDAADNGVELRVEDSGPGLAEVAYEKVFLPFYTTKADGIGIGLALSRSIVDAHGGRLWAESAPGGGALFRFTLPAAARDGD